MHRHRGFARACHTLHDHAVIGRFPDNFVLLLLDRRNDLPQNRLFIFCKIPRQKLIVCHDFRIIIVDQLCILDLIRPFEQKLDLHLLTIRYGVAAFSQSVFIIGIGHRCTPVRHHLMGGILCDAAPPDIEGFFFI